MGFLYSSLSVGGSVARAREARVSMIRLTQSIWIGARTAYWVIAADRKVTATETTVTVS